MNDLKDHAGALFRWTIVKVTVSNALRHLSIYFITKQTTSVQLIQRSYDGLKK